MREYFSGLQCQFPGISWTMHWSWYWLREIFVCFQNECMYLDCEVTFPCLATLIEHYHSHPLPHHGSLCLQKPYTKTTLPRTPEQDHLTQNHWARPPDPESLSKTISPRTTEQDNLIQNLWPTTPEQDHLAQNTWRRTAKQDDNKRKPCFFKNLQIKKWKCLKQCKGFSVTIP